MEQLLHVTAMAICGGAGATLGVVIVARWLGWSPVNITVNVTHLTRELELTD